MTLCVTLFCLGGGSPEGFTIWSAGPMLMRWFGPTEVLFKYAGCHSIYGIDTIGGASQSY